MTQERAGRLGKYFSQEAQPYAQEAEQGVRRSAFGHDSKGSYVLTEEVVHKGEEQITRHRVTLDDGTGNVFGAVLENGEIAGVEGFGEDLTAEDIAGHARDLFHGFARSEKSEMDPRM